MEFVEGETLEHLLRRSGRLEVKLALAITTQVAALLGSYLTDAYKGDICSYACLLCDDPWILEATEFNTGQCCLSERSDKSRHEAGNDQRDSPG
jgi:hypothetical protein